MSGHKSVHCMSSKTSENGELIQEELPEWSEYTGANRHCPCFNVSICALICLRAVPGKTASGGGTEIN